MNIQIAHLVKGDLTSYSERRLKLFENPEYTSDHLIHLHNVPAGQYPNVRKQAREIRSCLTQAGEYFQSAKTATLATRPVLLYYGLMSFALAEILAKKTADHRLSKLRASHAAHGLSLSVSGPIDPKMPLKTILSALSARVQFGPSGAPVGTFAVWRSVTRESPLPSTVQEVYTGGQTLGFRTSFVGSDEPPVLPKSGSLNLLDALVSLPQLGPLLLHLGIEAAPVRATLTHTKPAVGDGAFKMIVHPSSPTALDRFYNALTFDADAVNRWTITELPRGVILSCAVDKQGVMAGYISFPPAVTLNSKESMFVYNGWALGEFGAYYVALHILGNIARYYPDIWMQHVDASSTFSLLVDQLCEDAANRIPTLVAGEIERQYYVLDTGLPQP